MAKIVVEEGESFDAAFHRFNLKVSKQYSSRWYKSRIGFYEKTSVLKRKKKKMREILSKRASSNLWLKIGQKERYKRNGPNNSAGR